MAWDFDYTTALSTGVTVANISYIKEMYAAQLERAKALSPVAGGLTGPTVTDNAQSASWVSNLQSWIETNCTIFVNPLDTGTISTPDVVVDSDTIPYFSDSSDFFNAAGIGDGSGWIRRVDDDETNYAYGQAQAGDIIGPWIYEELQKAFDILLWTAPTDTFYDDGDDNRYAEGVFAAGNNWNAAKGSAESTYDSMYGSSYGDPWVYSGGVFTDTGGSDEQTPGYSATIVGNCPDQTIQAIWNGELGSTTVSKDAYWFVELTENTSIGDSTSWHAHGTGIAEDTWTNWLIDLNITGTSSAAGEEDIENSQRIFDMDSNYPTWVDEPDTNNVDYLTTQGFMTTSHAAVIDWQFIKRTE